MKQMEKNCVNSNLDNNKDETIIDKKFNETIIKIMSIPAAQYASQKTEDFIGILEKTFNWPVSQTNNNFKDHSYDLKNTENDTIYFQDNGVISLGWFFLIPTVFCFHLCHFYINITLFIINKPPIEFQDIRWYLQYTRFMLNDLRKCGSKKHRTKQKLEAQRLSKNPPELNFLCRVFSKWPLRVFVKKIRKILNFLGIITIPLRRDLKINGTNNHVSKEDNHRQSDSSKDQMPKQAVLTRRVSVTVQEIIFEENEDPPGNIKEPNDHLKTNN